MNKVARLVAVSVLTSLALVGCSSDADAPADSGAASVVDAAEAQSLIDAGAEVIDVRTPEEYDAGHVPGATNMDVEAADFHDRVDALDRDATYVLYCRTGSRAETARTQMLEMDFTDVVNAGGFDALAAADVSAD